ncbi:hypothetical protein [Pontimicrobium sp. SW4]|uniref:Uncharacterized protein n=1 Tax=Pontimicrobium sp. SW4 TaxID=3153519 RepID=A0AAU7BTX9_9FLAO
MFKKIIQLVLIILPFLGFSQNKSFEEVNIDAFINETQYSGDSANDLEVIWWIPTEYWNVIFAQDPMASAAELDAITDMLKEFVIVITIKGKMGVFGGITYDKKENIRSLTEVSINGENLSMIEEDNITPDMVNFVGMIKPMMENMIGPMGENMQVMLFENPKNKSLLPINPYSTDELKFSLGDFEKKVKLPLSCLLEDKQCPDDNEALNGKWNFCPIHGSKLINKKQ